MSAKVTTDAVIQPLEPFNGNGPQNLSPKMLHQAWDLTVILKYQRQVRELSEGLGERVTDPEEERE